MTRRLSHFEEPAYALLRIVAGLMFALHGPQKLLGWFGGDIEATGSQLWVGGIIETSCGLLIALGLFARPAAFLASGTMAVAYFQFHWKLRLAGSMWAPAANHGDAAVLFCFLWLLVLVRGAGPYSLDAKLRHA
ncbi:MAG TPA: DoxX family protein [Gemmatimonadaceae bacterium]|nr:DoxX family protein [Gemmatimonadaceae bacterium]